MLKFISYKQVTTEMVSILRQSGYEVYYVASQDKDMDEDKVCQKANAEQFVLLTGEREMADELVKKNKIQSGIVFFEHLGETPLQEAEQLMRVVQENENSIPLHYTKIMGSQIKSNPLTTA